MVEIVAIIRPNCLSDTKKKLIEIGYPGYTCQKAMGRGKKPVKFMVADGSHIRTNLVNKRILNIIVPDEAENDVVKAIMQVNSTQTQGDGKIFICPIENSFNVRTRKEIAEY